MVEDRITDGRRIAQLLASELDGRSDGPLADVAIANADPDVEPAVEGAHAYDVRSGGTTVAGVSVRPDAAHVAVSANADAAIEAAGARDLPAERNVGDDRTTIVVEHGAAVKRAVDALMAAMGAETSRDGASASGGREQ